MGETVGRAVGETVGLTDVGAKDIEGAAKREKVIIFLTKNEITYKLWSDETLVKELESYSVVLLETQRLFTTNEMDSLRVDVVIDASNK